MVCVNLVVLKASGFFRATLLITNLVGSLPRNFSIGNREVRYLNKVSLYRYSNKLSLVTYRSIRIRSNLRQE